MMKVIRLRLLKPFVAMMAFVGLTALLASPVWAGKLLDEMQVQDTCGTTYADNLATCTPFHCTKPSPMLMIFGVSEDMIKQMPLADQKKAKKAIKAAEKKVAAMSPQERAAMKSDFTHAWDIKGYNAQGLCQTEIMMSPKHLMRCAYDAPMLKRVSAYHKAVDTAKVVESDSRVSGKIHGKYVNTIITKVDGKVIDDPSAEVLNDGTCQSF